MTTRPAAQASLLNMSNFSRILEVFAAERSILRSALMLPALPN